MSFPVPGFFAAKMRRKGLLGTSRRIFQKLSSEAGCPSGSVQCLFLYSPEQDPQSCREQDHPNGRWCFALFPAAKGMQPPQQQEHHNGTEIRCNAYLVRCKPGQRRKRHVDCSCQDHCHHTGTNAAKNCVDSRILHQVLQHRCNEQDNDKGRQHHTQCRTQRALEAAL